VSTGRGIWICDIDGTLALHGGRGPFDWARVGEDQPNPPVVALVRALIRDGHSVIYVSGRMEQCRAETIEWLRRHVFGHDMAPLLYMRPDGDYRPDDTIKREIYDRDIAPFHRVTGVIDDRAKVVAMWRSLGLTCVQVAEGNF
jgi:hypothetical protein